MAPPVKARHKVVLLGEPMVGKTSLVRQYVQHSFSEDYLKTLGTSVSKRVEEFHLPDHRTFQLELTIWDIMGQKRLFEMLRESYLLGAKGALAVFDLTRRETLEGLLDWVEAARKEDRQIPIAVLGNKSDLGEHRQVGDDRAREFCASLEVPYFPTSAKTGENVVEAFREIARRSLERLGVAVPAA